MAYQIRINPNALREAGKSISGIGDQVQDTISTLRAQASRLDAAWDGYAGARAADTLMHNAMSLTPLVQAIESNGRRLLDIADAFSQAETGGVRPLDSGLLHNIVQIADRGMPVLSASISSENTLSVEPFVLRQVASRIEDASDRLWDIAHRLNSMGETLSADWEGRASDRFRHDNEIIADAMRKAANSLRTGAERIVHAAYRYEQMDAELM